MRVASTARSQIVEKVTIRYVADTAGLVSLDVEYPGEKNGDLPTIPAFGIEWALPVEYANLRFYGAGPEETYADRRHAKLGVWSTTAGDDCEQYQLPAGQPLSLNVQLKLF